MTAVVIGGTDCTAHLDAVVAAAPPLSQAQCDRLRGLFRYSGVATSAKPKRRIKRGAYADTQQVAAEAA